MKKHPVIKSVLITIAVIIILAAAVFVPSGISDTVSNSLSVSAHLSSAPLMIAHRGFSSIYPQNTLPAFEGAVEAGFDGYEFDIHTTKDGKWVVIHDDTVDDMTDGTGDVEDFTLEEIRKLKIDNGNGIENYDSLIVPTLEETLIYAEKNDIIPVIEIKKCDVKYLPDLKAILDEKGLSEKTVIISFTEEYLEEYRRLDKEIDIMLLAGTPTKEDVDWCITYNAGLNFGFYNFYKCHSAVKYARENGIRLASWTVDNVVFKDVMALFGAEIITTNKIVP